MINVMNLPTSVLAESLFRAAAHIRKAETAEAICQVLVEFAARLGFDRIIVCSLSPLARQGLIDEIFFVHGDWAEGLSASEREAYLLHCPVTQHILEFDEPFFWSKTASADLERMTYRIVRHPGDLGLVNGVQVPVFGHTGLEGAVSFAGELRDMSSDFRLALQAVCNLAFHELRRRRTACTDSGLASLTQREREILRWAAAGRRQAEIATILAISERTVENHLRSARRRLGVTSTAQAVARALTLGEITM